MALIDIKLNPTRKDLTVFAILWAIFFALLGKMSLWKPHALLIAAGITGAAFLISITFNRDQPRRMQLLGLLIPVTLLAVGGIESLGINPWHIAIATLTLGAVGAVAVLSSAAIGRTLYTGWMYAALPIGWTISHALLGAVYYLAFTPIGLIRRVLGHDPMSRTLDRNAATYWTARQPAPESDRYFRQF